MVPAPSRADNMLGHAHLFPSAEESHIMGMPATHDAITTIEALLALPEDGMRHELLDGAHAVTPAPEYLHQKTVMELELALAAVLRDRTDAEVLGSPADIVLGPRTLVQPDVFVIRKSPGKPVRRWSDVGVPLLVIEVLSPGTAARDRGAKRRIYQQAGVAEYWIVDLDARIVERWTPGDERPEIEDGALRWLLPEGASGEITLPALFRRIHGE